MPATLSYPGVYIEEIPSGVRTITGVATSITDFLGRALRGPTNEPVTINSYSDFERVFGGLWVNSTLGYSVRNFYKNGGNQAIIVRLYHPDSASSVNKATLTVAGLVFEAKSEGKWGNALRVRIDHDVKGVDAANLFNLSVRDGITGQVEIFRNVSVVSGHVRQVDKVLANESRLITITAALPLTRPAAHPRP